MFVKLLDGSYRRVDQFTHWGVHYAGDSNYHLNDASVSGYDLATAYTTEAAAQAALDAYIATLGLIAL